MSLIKTTNITNAVGTIELEDNYGIVNNNSTSLVNSQINIFQVNVLQVGEIPNSSNVAVSNNNLLPYLAREVANLCTIDDQIASIKEELKIDVRNNEKIITDFLGNLKGKISRIFLWKFQRSFEDYYTENKDNNHYLNDIINLRSEIIIILENTISHIGSKLQNGNRSNDLGYLTDADKILDLWNKLMNEIHKMFNSTDCYK